MHKKPEPLHNLYTPVNTEFITLAGALLYEQKFKSMEEIIAATTKNVKAQALMDLIEQATVPTLESMFIDLVYLKYPLHEWLGTYICGCLDR